MSLSNETFWDELFNPLKRVNCFQASQAPLKYHLLTCLSVEGQRWTGGEGYKGRQLFAATEEPNEHTINISSIATKDIPVRWG